MLKTRKYFEDLCENLYMSVHNDLIVLNKPSSLFSSRVILFSKIR